MLRTITCDKPPAESKIKKKKNKKQLAVSVRSETGNGTFTTYEEIVAQTFQAEATDRKSSHTLAPNGKAFKTPFTRYRYEMKP